MGPPARAAGRPPHESSAGRETRPGRSRERRDRRPGSRRPHLSRGARLGRAAAAGCAGLLLTLGSPGSARPAAGPAAPTADSQEFSGVLLPGMTALIKSRYKERVAEVPFAQGSRVQQGQLILRFADDQYRVERDRAAALLERAEADFDRAKQLHEQHDLSGQEFERAQTELKLARADLDLARLRFEERSILAPFDGVLA